MEGVLRLKFLIFFTLVVGEDHCIVNILPTRNTPPPLAAGYELSIRIDLDLLKSRNLILVMCCFKMTVVLMKWQSLKEMSHMLYARKENLKFEYYITRDFHAFFA
jgi:hypothetical protein